MSSETTPPREREDSMELDIIDRLNLSALMVKDHYREAATVMTDAIREIERLLLALSSPTGSGGEKE